MAWKPPENSVVVEDSPPASTGWTPPANSVVVESTPAQRLMEARRLDAETATSSVPAIIREPFMSAASGGANLMSAVSRPFSKDIADYFAETGQQIRTRAESYRKDDWSPWLSRTYGGILESSMQAAAAAPAGPYGVISSFALSEGNQALYEAEQAGLKGIDRLKYATVQGAIEGTIASVFQKIGLGGFEKFIPQIASRAMKLSGKQFLSMTAQEVPEELLTELGHAVAEASYGIDPNALEPENLVPRFGNTIAQTIGQMGLGQASAKIAQNRQMVEVLEGIGSKGFISRQESEQLGLTPEESKNRASRKKAVDDRVEQIQKQNEELEKVVEEVTKPPEQEPSDASGVQRTQAEIRQRESGEDLREQGEEQVPEEQTGEVAPASEVQVEPESEKTPAPDKMERDASRVVQLNDRIEALNEGPERDSAIALRDKIRGKYDTAEFDPMIKSLVDSRKEAEAQNRKARKSRNKTPEHKAVIARGRIRQEVDKIRQAGATQAKRKSTRKPIGAATWTTEDGVDRPVVVTHVSGLKGDEIFVGIEGSDTSVPVSQIRFEGEALPQPQTPAKKHSEPAPTQVDEVISAPEAPTQPQTPPETKPAEEPVSPVPTQEKPSGTITAIDRLAREIADRKTPLTSKQIRNQARRQGLNGTELLSAVRKLRSQPVTGKELEEQRRKSAEGVRQSDLIKRREQKAQEKFAEEVEPIHKAMLDAGWTLDKESESGSRYYSRGKELARVSDHPANPATQAWIDKNGVQEISRIEDVPAQEPEPVKKRRVKKPKSKGDPQTLAQAISYLGGLNSGKLKGEGINVDQDLMQAGLVGVFKGLKGRKGAHDLEEMARELESAGYWFAPVGANKGDALLQALKSKDKTIQGIEGEDYDKEYQKHLDQLEQESRHGKEQGEEAEGLLQDGLRAGAKDGAKSSLESAGATEGEAAEVLGEVDESFDFGANVKQPPGIPGAQQAFFEKDVKQTLFNVSEAPKRAAEGETRKSVLERIEEERKESKKKSIPGQQTLPGGNAMAALTEGDSYKPAEMETESAEEVGSKGKATVKKSTPSRVVSDLVGMASPAHVSDISREAGHLMREEMARAAQWGEAHSAALRGMERKFSLMSPDSSYEFMDRLEAGEKQETPELDKISNALRRELDKGRDRLRSLGKLQDFYENYFPHMWKDSEHARDTIRSISSGKPWRSSGFLKQRTHITMKEGRDAGLVPISDNPIEMALLRLHQVNKYVARTNIMERLKQAGMMKFVPESFDKSYMPSGYEYYDDPAFRVVTDPSLTMEEAYDKLLVDQLSAVLNRMGVSHERVASMSRGRWGEQKPGEIKTRYAGPVSVLAHELGHQIGQTWGLFEYLTKGAPVEGRRFKTGKRAGQEVKADSQRKRAQMQRELRALADLRVEGQEEEVVEKTKTYRRKKSEKEAVILEAWLAAPDKMAEVAPMVTEAWKDFLRANEPVSPLLNLDRSVVLGTRKQEISQPGTLTLGKWAMPSDVARMVKNMLSPGLRSNPNTAVKGLYNLGRIMGNSMNQASLSLSGFHALNVLTDATASQIGLGIQQATRGKLGRSGWNLVTAPAAGVIGVVKGGELRKAMQSDISDLSPEMRAFVETAIDSGARASMDPVYHNYSTRRIVDSIRKLRWGTALQKVDASVRLPVQAILGGLEMTAKPIMEWMVPRMKLAVFYNLSKDVYDRANTEGLSDYQIREQLTQAWDSVDNRLGQLAYDNLFWNQYLKDVSMLSVRSVGWNLGSFREYGGAVLDVTTTASRLRRGDQVISRKMGYAIGAVMTYAPLGMLLMYAFTGDTPEELKDYFFPKTGRTNPDGSPERLSLPTYAKDWVAWTTQPLTVAKHKLHPMWGTMADVLTNENYYGAKIRNEDDPWYTKLSDTMVHVAESFTPFSVKNLERFNKAGEDPRIAIAMAFSGITSAPAYISRSPAQKLAYELMIGNIPQGSRTSAQVEASQKRKELVKRLREGGKLTEEEVATYSKQQLKLIEKEAKQTPFQTVVSRLSGDQAMKVWELADDKEQDQIRDSLQSRFIKHASDYGESVNERDKALQAVVYLKKLGVDNFDEADRLLRESYTEDGRFTRAERKSYGKKRVMLEEIFGE